ncbi:MAG: LmbZ [Gemmatimonadetes bacterium]|nr:MAG: LmbZ [Gemmatimonadota bacterium]
MSEPLRVGIVGCGLVGNKRADALRQQDRLVGCVDVLPGAAQGLAARYGGRACADVGELLELGPQVVIVATPHDQLAALAGQALHRFYPGLARAVEEVHSGSHGELMHLRARYGHGGRLGYEREWRADPLRSGGGELIDQGMHLLDLVHWIAGPLPLHSSLLRTQFWDAPVEDNAALLLGADEKKAPWAMLHVSWTEWKNTFSLEIFCRSAKLQVDGLARSYGPQTLRIYRMKPELGPPDVEEVTFPAEDVSWRTEWEHFAAALAGEVELLGSLADARYAWACVEEAYAGGPYTPMRKEFP